jgi:hypothetical protein
MIGSDMTYTTKMYEKKHGTPHVELAGLSRIHRKSTLNCWFIARDAKHNKINKKNNEICWQKDDENPNHLPD